ncbi:hypothetical protein [Nodosilinea sp. LEGE 06152]|uniref:hypothetical protein n=1 Tax=Nodosilinea sp. LEGE 06152 TaxID=2777966 RepID=UPI0018801B66|nr:hypothetical protein [Nodosilinea sp. LEGE 06152]
MINHSFPLGPGRRHGPGRRGLGAIETPPAVDLALKPIFPAQTSGALLRECTLRPKKIEEAIAGRFLNTVIENLESSAPASAQSTRRSPAQCCPDADGWSTY